MHSFGGGVVPSPVASVERQAGGIVRRPVASAEKQCDGVGGEAGRWHRTIRLRRMVAGLWHLARTVLPPCTYASRCDCPSPPIFFARILCGVVRADALPSGSTTSDAGPGGWSAIRVNYDVTGEVVDGSGEGAVVVVRLSAFFAIVGVTICSRSLRGPRASVLYLRV